MTERMLQPATLEKVSYPETDGEPVLHDHPALA